MQNNDSFNPQEAIRTLEATTNKLTNDLKNTDVFGEYMIKTISKNKDVDVALKKLLLDIIRNNNDFRNQVNLIIKTQLSSEEYKKLLNDHTKNYIQSDLRYTFKKWGKSIITSIGLIFLSMVPFILSKVFS